MRIDILITDFQGISDTPAWIVSKANLYARLMGKTPFCIYQGMWSVMHRDLERDIIPMVKSEGMALAPFNVLASGKIRSDEQERQRRETGEKGGCDALDVPGPNMLTVHCPLIGRTFKSYDWERTEDERHVANLLQEVAQEVGAKSITSGEPRGVSMASVLTELMK